MDIVFSTLPLWVVLIPLGAVPIAGLLKDKASHWFVSGVCLLSFLMVLAMYPPISDGKVLSVLINIGLKLLVFMADSFSLLAGLIFSAVWTLASLYTVKYMAHEHDQRRYNVFSLLSLAGALGVVFTRNLFALYIFFELLSITSYVMVIHDQSSEALAAGIKYILTGLTGGLVLLAAIIATRIITGTTDMVELANGAAQPLRQHPYVGLIFLGYVLGFGVKAGIFPLHVWLPDTHPVAPAPASALLSGVMIKVGAYGIIRTVYSVIGFEALQHQPVIIALLVIAFINIFLGSAMAIQQTELNRMLAFSSIAQMGYIILGVALLSPYGITGGLMHIFNHAIMKGALFLCAGAFIHKTGLHNLEDLRGIGKRMPLTTACFTLAALSMIGFPPFVGFVSQWYLALGTLQAIQTGSYSSDLGMFALGILLLGSLMTLLYYGPIIYRAWFFTDETDDDELILPELQTEATPSDDPDREMMIPVLVLGMSVLVFGIFPNWPLQLAHIFSGMYFH